MKNSIENIETRQKEILQHLSKHHELSVRELAELCQVSSATIRRDLMLMEEKGQLKRKHGGAKIQERVFPFDEAPEITRIRHSLAKAACTFIKENDVLFFNSSKTALYVLHYIGNIKTTIITNNVQSVYLKSDDNATLVLSGGEIRFPIEAMVGDIALNTIANATADICIMGCNGIHPLYGITTDNLHEAKVNRLLFENTVGLKIVIADHRKIGVRSSFKSVDSRVADILITDIYAPEKVLHSLEQQGIRIIQIDPLNQTDLVIDQQANSGKFFY